MFGIGLPECILIGIIALIVLGPEKLPELARTAGKLGADFKKMSDGMRKEFYNSVYKPAEMIQTARTLTATPVSVATVVETLTKPPLDEVSTTPATKTPNENGTTS